MFSFCSSALKPMCSERSYAVETLNAILKKGILLTSISAILRAMGMPLAVERVKAA